MNGQANTVNTDNEVVFDSTFLEDTMLSEISQIQKDKYFHDLVFMWNLGGRVQLVEAESKIVATRTGVGVGEGCWSKGTRVQLCRMRKF